ncbi:MAG TPA: AAA family ATPase [Thermoleophilaceae bacterium]|nr:AAA family ATPase [Thermoleophilaceae bacterium]
MHHSADPYTPGSGIKPLKLAGRDAELEALESLLDRVAAGLPERSLIYSGLRGVGKTVLLLEFETLAREAGWATNEVEEVGSGDFRLTLAELAYQLLLSMSRKERMRKRARQALGVLGSFAIESPGGFRAKLDVDIATGTADSGDPERDLAALLTEIGEVARTGRTGALFLLDEMQGLSPEAMAAICMALNRVGQRGLPVALVGAGLPPLPRLLRSAKPYAERLFSYRELNRLSDAQARMALVGPAALKQVEYEPEAVELIVERSRGYPHFIQEFGRVLWREVESSPITAADVQGAQALVDSALDRRFFKDRFESATDGEQRYLAAMAELGDGPVKSADVARQGAYRTRGSASLPRDQLLRKDLIYSPRRGLLDFTVPLFTGYIRRIQPLSDFVEGSG